MTSFNKKIIYLNVLKDFLCFFQAKKTKVSSIHNRKNQQLGLNSSLVGIHEKNHIIEEPYEVKVSRTVLKTSRLGDWPA